MAKKHCPHCGAPMVEYKHGLSKGLCRSLARVALRFKDTEPHDINDMGMDYNHRCNFQKLQYWELIERVGDPDSKGGLWRITDKGMEFLKGNISVPRFVWTYRGQVVRFEGEDRGIAQIADGWKYRPDYARESNPI